MRRWKSRDTGSIRNFSLKNDKHIIILLRRCFGSAFFAFHPSQKKPLFVLIKKEFLYMSRETRKAESEKDVKQEKRSQKKTPGLHDKEETRNEGR